ncbi:MAG: sigma-70 family RNA polymerase sigma factor [Planctomycetes bacterium]|nr:sigma-70 family RNA polymerase sigma factor [Planctomycetota bacterium]
MKAAPDRAELFLEEIEAHKQILHKVSRAYCAGREDRADLVQEIVVQLWRSFASFEGRAKFSTWMYRIALNVAISFQRRNRANGRDRAHADGELLQYVAAPEPEPGSEAIDELYRRIARFEDFDRALILLYLDGNPHAAIAEVLGISLTNVATRISRLKERLRQGSGGEGSANS